MGNHILAKLERDYRICMSRYERAEMASETVVGLKMLEQADKKIVAERRVLAEKMEKISYLIRVQVDPEWTPGHLSPLHVHRKAKRGVFANAAYRVLKAAKEPLSVRAIAKLAAVNLGLKPTGSEMDRLATTIAGCMRRRLVDGDVEKIEGDPVRWQVPCKKSAWVAPPSLVASAPLRRAAGSDRAPI